MKGQLWANSKHSCPLVPILFLVGIQSSPIVMSDREGHSGGGAPTDEDLSLPKATVAKMIAGTQDLVRPTNKHVLTQGQS